MLGGFGHCARLLWSAVRRGSAQLGYVRGVAKRRGFVHTALATDPVRLRLKRVARVLYPVIIAFRQYSRTGTYFANLAPASARQTRSRHGPAARAQCLRGTGPPEGLLWCSRSQKADLPLVDAQRRPKGALGEAREDACGAELAAGDEVRAVSGHGNLCRLVTRHI